MFINSKQWLTKKTLTQVFKSYTFFCSPFDLILDMEMKRLIEVVVVFLIIYFLKS
jgi:hypothetical protein